MGKETSTESAPSFRIYGANKQKSPSLLGKRIRNGVAAAAFTGAVVTLPWGAYELYNVELAQAAESRQNVLCRQEATAPSACGNEDWIYPVAEIGIIGIGALSEAFCVWGAVYNMQRLIQP